MALPAAALDRTNEVFKIFQFPPDKIPTIDGKTNDWDIVPESYVIGSDQLVDDNGKHQMDRSRPRSNVRVQRRLGQGLEPAVFSLRGRRRLLGFFPAGIAQRHV